MNKVLTRISFLAETSINGEIGANFLLQNLMTQKLKNNHHHTLYMVMPTTHNHNTFLAPLIIKH